MLWVIDFIGGGLAGMVPLAYARRAGLGAAVLEAKNRVGGLWRDLLAWHDNPIGCADWTLGDLPPGRSDDGRSVLTLEMDDRESPTVRSLRMPATAPEEP